MITLYKEGDRGGAGPYVHARKWRCDTVTDVIIEWGCNKDGIDPRTMTRIPLYHSTKWFDGYGVVDSEVIKEAIALYKIMQERYNETRQD